MEHRSFRRARSAEKKAARARDILAAAGRILDSQGIEAVTLGAIAGQAGMVKSGLYRYFESREEILLRLLIADLRQMVEAMESRFAGPMPVEEVTALLSGAFSTHPRLCILISQLAPILERNISTATLRDIKARLIELAWRAASALGRALPDLRQTQRLFVINTIFSLVAGLWPMTNPGPALAALLREPQFAPFDKRFAPSLNAAIAAVLRGAASLEEVASPGSAARM